MGIAPGESGGFDRWGGVALDEAHAPVAFLEVDFHELNGQALDGLGDDLERTITWAGGADVSALRGTPVRLRWFLKDADLYAFQFPE